MLVRSSQNITIIIIRLLFLVSEVKWFIKYIKQTYPSFSEFCQTGDNYTADMKTTRNPEGDDETELDKLCVHCVAGSQVCLGVGTQKES